MLHFVAIFFGMFCQQDSRTINRPKQTIQGSNLSNNNLSFENTSFRQAGTNFVWHAPRYIAKGLWALLREARNWQVFIADVGR